MCRILQVVGFPCPMQSHIYQLILITRPSLFVQKLGIEIDMSSLEDRIFSLKTQDNAVSGLKCNVCALCVWTCCDGLLPRKHDIYCYMQ